MHLGFVCLSLLVHALANVRTQVLLRLGQVGPCQGTCPHSLCSAEHVVFRMAMGCLDKPPSPTI